MSRATLIDERPEEELEATDQLDTEDTVETPEEQPQAESELPEKYQGKSVEDLVQMHQELERFTGKQSTEVGELRKVVDNHIQTQLVNQPAPQQQQQEDDTDFFIDPTTAVNRAIDNHPKIKEAEAYTQQYKQQATLAQLKSKHPEMEGILQDPKFAEWIQASKVRTKLFVDADQQYDAEAADELFSLWKERKTVAQQTVKVEKQARKQQIKAANTGNA